MGEEIEYVIQDEVECDCGNTISFRISGFEYPVGAFDYESNEIVGGDFVEKPHMGIVYYAEDFDLYLAETEYEKIHSLIMQISGDKELLSNFSVYFRITKTENCLTNRGLFASQINTIRPQCCSVCCFSSI